MCRVLKNKSDQTKRGGHDSPDLWQPSASITMLKRRAALLAAIRQYFQHEVVMEIETPILSQAGNPDCYIESFETQTLIDGRDKTLYMQTSPEFFMKRLLAAGSGSIYQIAKAFRHNETGRLHNPEFTMLEWYRIGYDYQELMRDVENLLKSIGMLDTDATIPRLTYAEVFEEHIGLNPHLCTLQNLLHALDEHKINIESVTELSRNDCLSLLLTHVIEPALRSQAYLYIYDYPADQAALAVTRNQAEYAVAERFELYVEGIEVANGYTELTDSDIQAQRFDQEVAARTERGLPSIKTDEHLIAALNAGLPACAGVAVGVDRLLMISASKSCLPEVLAFPIDRA